jgi:hypothetical protein
LFISFSVTRRWNAYGKQQAKVKQEKFTALFHHLSIEHLEAGSSNFKKTPQPIGRADWRATKWTSRAISYEEDFLGFSYGFRPGRDAHDAIDSLMVAIESRKLNFILDADIGSFFDTVEWLIHFMEHRVGALCGGRSEMRVPTVNFRRAIKWTLLGHS